MSFFDTISRIIQQGKEMAVKATPSSTLTYNKVTPVDNSQFTSNPLLRDKPLTYQPPVVQQPTFNVPVKAEIPQASTRVAETTPQQTNLTMAQQVSNIIQGGKEAAVLGGGLAKDVARGTTRGAMAGGTFVGARLLGADVNTASQVQFKPKTGLEKFLFGEQPVSVQSEGISPLESMGVSTDTAKKYGAPFVLGSIALDAFTGGSSKGARRTLEKVAANMTAEDATLLRNLYTKPDVKNVMPRAKNEQAIISALKLDKLPYTEQKKAVSNILEAYEKRWGGVDEALNPPVKPNRPGAMDVKKPNVLDKTVLKKTEPLEVEAKKYKSADDFVKAQIKSKDYTMSHRPTEGVRAFDLTEKVDGEQMIPRDMYSQWYGSRGTIADKESISVLKKIKGNPDAEVTIYRASPSPDFNDGDWVSFSKSYAEEHAQGNGTKVYSKKVLAKDVKWAMDDVNEFGYFPEEPRNQLRQIWEKANLSTSPTDYKSADDFVEGMYKKGYFDNIKGSKARYDEEIKLTDIWKQANTKQKPNKMADYRAGKPNSEGGYIRNPLAGKGETPKANNQVVSSGNDNIDSYIEENIKKRQEARGELSIGQKINETANLTGVKLVDFTLPITNTLNKGLKKDPIARAFLEKNPSQNVNNQIDRVLRAPTLAGKYVEDNGLDKIIQQVDDIDEFDEYLIAKHAIDVDTRGINTGRNVKRDEQLVKALSPRYEKHAQAVMKYNRDLLDKVTDAGLISKETNAMLKERYPNYVPLQRVFDVMEEAPVQGSGRGVGSLSKQTVVQKIVGSDREIESPMRSILERTNNAVFQIEKNETAKIIASYEKLKDNPFNLKQIADTKDAGRGMGTISFFKDGKKVIYEVNEDVANAAKALNVEQMNILSKILAVPVRVARAGITGLNPAFIAKNVARDQVGAFIMADRGLRASPLNPKNFLKSLWSTVKHNKLYDEWIREAGGGTSYDLGREQIKPTLDRIRAGRSKTSKVLYTVTRPSEMLRVVEDFVARSEEITRIQQYRAARDSAIERGLSAKEAKVAGAQQSRENSTNFARRGEWGTVMNSTILYLNAGIQGSRLTIRNLKNKPIKTTAKIVSSLMFPVATVTYWNISDPERKKAYDDIEDYEKENNIIVIPPNPVKDEQGKWNAIKIPLPPGVGNFASLVRLPIEKMNDSNPEISSEVYKALTRTVSPIDVTSARGVISGVTPQIIKPSVEALTNKSLFTGNPIVYQSEEKLSPKLQVRDYTSGTAQGIANILGVSPIKTEAFIRSTGGGITDNLLNASDRALVSVGLMSPDKIGGKSVTESVKAGFFGAKGGKTEREVTDKIYEIRKTSADNAEIRKQDAERILGELKTLKPDEANARLKEIKASDELLFKKIKDLKLAEDLNWSKEEKAIANLGVTDGTKARYVYSQVNKLGTAEEKNAYLKELLDRKIISKEVLKQIKDLKEGGKNNDIIE